MGRKRDARFFRVEQGDFGQVDCPRRNFLGDFLRSFSRIVNRAADGDCRAVREQPSVCHVLHNHVGHRHVVCVHTVYAEQPQNGALNGDGGVKVDIALRVRGNIAGKMPRPCNYVFVESELASHSALLYVSVVSQKSRRFEGESLTLFQPRDSYEFFLFFCGAVGAAAHVFVMNGLTVRSDDALEIAQDYLVGGHGYEILRHDGDFAAAAGRVHDKGGHRKAACMSAQSFYDFDSLGNGRAEVLQAHAQVALINVIRSHSYFDQLVNQSFHDVNAVVDARKQHALVSERYTRVSKHFAGAT